MEPIPAPCCRWDSVLAKSSIGSVPPRTVFPRPCQPHGFLRNRPVERPEHGGRWDTRNKGRLTARTLVGHFSTARGSLMRPRQGRCFSDSGRPGPGRWDPAEAQSLYPASTPEGGESPRLPSPAGVGAHSETKASPSVSSQRANTRSRCSSESNDVRYSSPRGATVWRRTAGPDPAPP
jgi:hypothetical protein